MPRKNPLSERELAICGRLRYFRRELLLVSQSSAARKLGIDSTRLVAVEHGRVPLRFDLADRFAFAFNMNQAWLAEGKMHPFNYWKIPGPVRESIDNSELFSTVWDRCLQSLFDRLLRENPMPYMEHVLSQPPENLTPAQVQENLNLLIANFKRHLAGLALPTQWQFLSELGVVFGEMKLRDASYQFDETEWHKDGKSKVPVDECSRSINIPPVKSPMDDLLHRLTRATANRGMKMKLAAAMGVSRANVSQWLSGKRKPNGETTLQLLRWVEDQEKSEQ